MPSSPPASLRPLRFAAKCVGTPHPQANKFRPTLRSFDRFGRRVDVAEYHPSYHHLMAMGLENRIPSYAWGSEAGKPGAMVVRSTLSMLHFQVCLSCVPWLCVVPVCVV